MSNWYLEGAFRVLPYSAGILTAFAAIYNIGFFYGIGVGFFTLFSIQDHIIFTLNLVPLLFLFSGLSISIYILISSVFFHGVSIDSWLGYMENSLLIYILKYIILSVLLILFAIAYSLRYIGLLKEETTYLYFITLAPILILIAMLLHVGSIGFGDSLVTIKNRSRVIAACVILIALQTIFSTGVVGGIKASEWTPRRAAYVIDGRQDRVALVRSGGNGILYVVPNGDIEFLRRESFSLIRRLEEF